MKRSMILAALAVAATGLAGCERPTEEKSETASAGAVERPARKAGLWRQTTTLQGAQPQTLRLCVDPSVEDSLPWWGRVAQAGACEEQVSRKNPDGSYAIKARCEMGGAGASSIEGAGSGDFAARYQVQVRMVTVGAANPQLNGPRDLSHTFEYEGECPEGWSLGDVEVPGGMRMNYDPNQVAREIEKAQKALQQQEAQTRVAEQLGVQP